MRRLLASLALLAFSAVSTRAQVEIAYDDGTYENAINWDVGGSGAAVRFTAPGCALIGAKLYVLANVFLNDVGICVLDSNGPGGTPGDTLVGYFEVPVTYPPEEVTFLAPIALPHADFYVEYVQTGWGTFESDFMGLDTSTPSAGRSWLHLGGVWSLMPSAQGNVMIHAVVMQPTPAVPRTWGGIKGRYR